MENRKFLTREQALQKLRHYCGYQERCHQEVKEKLYSLGIRKSEQDEIIATLIEENYLNELRFAVTFAGGKFRAKQWGREKIKNELKGKGLSDYCIQKGLREIEEEDYRRTLNKLYKKRWASLKGEPDHFIRIRKTRDYLIQKGYEWELVAEFVKPN